MFNWLRKVWKGDGKSVKIKTTLLNMKRYITLLLLVATVSLSNAQQPDTTRNASDKAATGDTSIVSEEDPATFPGGDKALKSFLSNNLIYPKKAIKKGIQGTVLVEFVVEKDGSISKVIVKRGVSRELDSEAVRVVSLMPKWIPATIKGEIVRSYYRLPVHFALQ